MNGLKHLISLILVIYMLGCSHQGTIRIFNPKWKARKCSAIVLFFINETKNPVASELATRVFISKLIEHRWNVINLENTRNIYIQQEIIPGTEINLNFIEFIKKNIKVDCIITGRLIKMSYDSTGDPEISLWISIIDRNTLNPIINIYISKTGSQYTLPFGIGKVSTLSELMANISEDIITILRERGIGCE